MSENSTIDIDIGGKAFTLDRKKAEQAFQAKRVINGLDTMFFNILPLKYQWAYDMYKDMKSSHWDPEDANLVADVKKLESGSVDSAVFQQLISVFVHYERFFNTDIIGDIRDLATAPELKLVVGRFVHDSNVRNDLSMHLVIGLKQNLHTCAESLATLKPVQERDAFIKEQIAEIGREEKLENPDLKKRYALNIASCLLLENISFQSVIAAAFKAASDNSMEGVQDLIKHHLTDVERRTKLMSLLYNELLSENPDINDESHKNNILSFSEEILNLELKLLTEAKDTISKHVDAAEAEQFIRWQHSKAVSSIGFTPKDEVQNPFQWMENVSEGGSAAHTISESTSSLAAAHDDEL